jgi:hypothetical protein
MDQGAENSGAWSQVWQHFEKVFKEINGEQVRFAKCNICSIEIGARSSHGTGHLRKHIKNCKQNSGVSNETM